MTRVDDAGELMYVNDVGRRLVVGGVGDEYVLGFRLFFFPKIRN